MKSNHCFSTVDTTVDYLLLKGGEDNGELGDELTLLRKLTDFNENKEEKRSNRRDQLSFYSSPREHTMRAELKKRERIKNTHTQKKRTAACMLAHSLTIYE